MSDYSYGYDDGYHDQQQGKARVPDTGDDYQRGYEDGMTAAQAEEGDT